jgi:hypothetical protein
MTPQEYLAQVDELLSAGQDQALLELAERWGPAIHSQLTPEELAGVSGVMHWAATVGMLEASGESPATVSRSA